MNPLDALADGRELARRLSSRPVLEVKEKLEEIRAESPKEVAALVFGRASLALREGRLDDAKNLFADAAEKFAALSEDEAAAFSIIEGAVARTRRGRRELAEEAEVLVTPLLSSAFEGVRVRALLVHGGALRVLGQAAKAQAVFVEALDASRGFPETRSMVLNSLGTLSVTLGAFGAATSLCEHAAELCRLRQDVIGEAIAMGQLGAASLGKGELDAARRYLSRQEWLSRQVGDAFGQTRALVWLAEVALDDTRIDDAILLADQSIAVAESVEPKLTTFMAYANRIKGRAKLRAGDATGRDALALAEATFREQRLPLGQALSSRDLAAFSVPVDRTGVRDAVRTLAALGLVERVLESLPLLDASPFTELALAQTMPRRLEPMEAALMVSEPTVLSDSAVDRMSARKNLGRLAVLASEPAGLLIGAARVPAGNLATASDSLQTSFSILGQLGDFALIAWPRDLTVDLVREDLTRLAAVSIALTFAPLARVVAPNFGGGFGAKIADVDVVTLLASVPASGAQWVGSPGPFASLAGAP